MERVVDRFVAHRLLTVHQNTVEVSHEALLSAWPRLREWLDADRAGLRVRSQLSEAAHIWDEADRDASGLLRGGRLEAALSWASSADHGGDLNQLEWSFLEASEDDDSRQRAAVRRRSRRLQGLTAVVAALAVAAGTLAIVSVAARNNAVHARDMALSRQVAIEAARLRVSDPSLAAQLALAGYRISATPDARSALLDSSAVLTPTRILGQPGATALAVTGDGRTMAVSRAIDGSVQLYSLPPGGQAIRRGDLSPSTPGSTPFAVAFSPDGSILAAGGTDNSVGLWDVADPAQPRPFGHPLTGLTDAVQSITFSPDGHTIAAAGTAAGVLRWDVTAPAHPVALTPLGTSSATQTVAFSPDGTTVAAGSTDGTVRLWNTNGIEPTLLAQFPSAIGTTVNSVAFSPDGHTLAAGNKDKTIRRWDLSNLAAPTEIGPPLTGFNSWVNSVAFSPDGRTLAAGSSDRTIKFWDVDGWQPRAVSLTNPAPVTAIRFLPGSDDLVSVAEDGAARLWPLPGPIIYGPTDSIYALVYSSDGRRLAVVPNHAGGGIEIWDTSNSGHPRRFGHADLPAGIGVPDGSGSISRNGQILAGGTSRGKVQLFDIADPTKPIPLGPPLVQSTALVEQVAFSPDGHLLAAGGDDNTIVLWDVTDPGHPTPLTRLTAPTNQVLGIAFSTDSTLLAAASADKTVRLWSIATPQHAVPTATLTGFDNYVYSVAFSPDGHLLAAGSADKTLRLWDISDPHHPRRLGRAITGPDSTVGFVAIDPHGLILAAAVADGSVWQWDITNPARPHHLATLTALPGEVFVLAYSPDGHSLAAAGDDKTVHLWSTNQQQVTQEICVTTGDPITRNEWTQYIPNRAYRPPCP